MSNIKTLNYIMENLDASSEAVAPALKNVFRVYNAGTCMYVARGVKETRL